VSASRNALPNDLFAPQKGRVRPRRLTSGRRHRHNAKNSIRPTTTAPHRSAITTRWSWVNPRCSPMRTLWNMC